MLWSVAVWCHTAALFQPRGVCFQWWVAWANILFLTARGCCEVSWVKTHKNRVEVGWYCSGYHCTMEAVSKKYQTSSPSVSLLLPHWQKSGDGASGKFLMDEPCIAGRSWGLKERGRLYHSGHLWSMVQQASFAAFTASGQPIAHFWVFAQKWGYWAHVQIIFFPLPTSFHCRLEALQWIAVVSPKEMVKTSKCFEQNDRGQ